VSKWLSNMTAVERAEFGARVVKEMELTRSTSEPVLLYGIDKTREAELWATDQESRFHIRSGRKTLPADFKTLYRENCAPSNVVILPLGHNHCPDGITIPVCKAVSAKCSESFEGYLRFGFKPYVDYGHQADTHAGVVTDIYHCPLRGTVAVVDWDDWAQEEILKGSCDSFSPSICINEDLQIDGTPEAVGGLLHRSMNAGIPRLQGSIKPISKLEDFVCRATQFRRRVNELKRTGVADAGAALAQRMPRSHAAFIRFSELESDFGSGFYLNHS